METMDKGIDQGRIFSCLFLKLEAIEEKMDHITQTLDEHREILKLEAVEEKLDHITQTLDEHREILNKLDKSQENSDQRRPTNPVGKRQYSKEFLISLSERPECNIPPTVPMFLKVDAEQAATGASTEAPAAQPQQQVQLPAAAFLTKNCRDDHSFQWSEFYRSVGKIKEAELVETLSKRKTKANKAIT